MPERGVMAMTALAGIRIIDMTRYLPGSFTSLTFADFGAEVIMVERPGQGEPGRTNPPFINNISARHLLLQRNKKSITLDFVKPAGKEVLLDLICTADVLIENFRPGFMAEAGLGYDDIKNINQEIIYCSLTGFGQKGPYRENAGHDINYVALAGILGVSGTKETPGSLPGVQIADLCGSLMAQIGILIALQARQRTGKGQYIDMAFLDGAISLLPLLAAAYFAEGKSYEPGQHIYTGSMAWYNIYWTKDQKLLSIGALEKKFWQSLCEFLGFPEFVAIQFDPGQQEIMKKQLQDKFLSRTRDEWMKELGPLNVCVSPVHTIAEVFNDSNTIEREMVFSVNHPQIGAIKQIGFPIKMSGTPARYRKEAPELGENNDEIFIGLGYSSEKITELKNQKII